MMNSDSSRKSASSSKKKTTSQLDRRSSPRRTNGISSIKHSGVSRNIFSFLTNESTGDTKFSSLNSTISTDSSSDLLLNTSENTQPKSTFWTVTDRQADWYKLTTPADVQSSSISHQSVPFKIFSEISPEPVKTTDELDCPTTTTQLIMKAVMKELDYDMDNEDSKFLVQLNETKLENQQRTMSEDEFENAIIIFEYSTAENIRSYLKQRICDDEAIVCDICLLPDGDDGNEMVFCERCHICVHQDCYGISVVPSGKWFCKPCSILRRPNCLLCPKIGGPMASSSSGMIWCHLTCAIWLPELKFADYDKMEPILNLHRIPHARWSLRCVVCSTSEGACVQCAEKNCRTPFHVTCGLAQGFFLDVQQIKSKDSQQLRSQFNAYCSKHSTQARERCQKISSNSSSIRDDDDSSCSSSSSFSSISSPIPLTIYRRNQLKFEKWLTECYKKFDTFVSQTQLHDECSSNYDVLTSKKIFDYWKAKREIRGSLPLINRIDFVLEQRENADLLISQINSCLNVEKKIIELKNHCKSTIDSFTSSSSLLTERLQWLKENFNGTPSTSRKRRCRHRSLEPMESFGGRSSKRRRQNFFYSSEHLQTIERAKHCQVLLESSYREQLQLNTTYFIVETVEGEMFLAPKTLFDHNPLMSLVDSDETEKENELSEISDDEDLIRSQKAIDVFHTVMQTPYRSLGNVVTCITGSFN